MNMIDATRANAEAMPKNTGKAREPKVIEGMHEIEGDLHDLVNMVRIMVDMLDDEFRPEPYGDALHIVIGRQHMDMCSFAWSDVVRRANALKKRFDAALDGRAAA